MESENSNFLQALAAEKQRLLEIEQQTDLLTRDEIDVIIKLVGSAIDEEVPGFSDALNLISTKQKSIIARRDAMLSDGMSAAFALDEDVVEDAFDGMHAALQNLDAEQADLRNDCDQLKALTMRRLSEVRYYAGIQKVKDKAEADLETFLDVARSLVDNATSKAVIPKPVFQDIDNSALISAVIREYSSEQKAVGNWTEKTAEENQGIYSLWIRIVGDLPISQYGHTSQRQYRATLIKLPPNLNKDVRYRGKTIEEILALEPIAAQPNTINKHMQRVSALLKWAVGVGYLQINPASGLSIKSTKRPNQERQIFSKDDLKRLFINSEFGSLHQSPYMFWSPLIALFTGARLNEIAQLDTADFVVVSGINAISINNSSDGKRLKTSSSKRLIPLHTELIRLGLLDYVRELRSQKATRLFPELKQGRDGYGQVVSKWFNRYRNKHGVSESGKVFHSFRHTVTDHLKQKGLPEVQVAALLGHETAGITFARYGKDFSPDVMVNVVNALSFDLELKPRKQKYQ